MKIKKTINSYNNLQDCCKKTLNIKYKQFEQNLLNTFLEDQKTRDKQGK